jgi:ligand-binding SRPBCC domain-containing protein
MHELRTSQFLPISKEQAWEFLSDPKNLAKISPQSLNFKITSKIDSKMYSGQIITYKVHPIFGIPLTWVTEITHIEKPSYFVDEQRFGPYSFWHHKHFIKEVEGGVIMEDIIHYKLPLGFIGRLINKLIVAKKLEFIFSFREDKLNRIFSTNELIIN